MSNLLKKVEQDKIDRAIADILLKTDKTYPEYPLEEIIKSYGGISASEVDFLDQKDNVQGAVSYSPAPRIFINEALSPARKTFTLAHEFGHYILHENEKKFRLDFINYDGSEGAREESEANYFAAALLMPKQEFLRIYEITSEKNVADYFGVSLAAVRARKEWLKKN